MITLTLHKNKVLTKIESIMLILALVFCSMKLNATKYQTIANGTWSDSTIWENNKCPHFVLRDTVILNHYILLDSSITMHNNSYLHIAAEAGLCGHHTLTLYDKPMIMKYGYLDLDYILQTGGLSIFNKPKPVLLSNGFKLTGGRMEVNGCGMKTGYWFECGAIDNFVFNGPITEFDNEFKVVNPFEDELIIYSDSIYKGRTYYLYDFAGRLILNHTFDSNSTKVPTNNLESGFYFLKIIVSKKDIVTKKLVHIQ